MLRIPSSTTKQYDVTLDSDETIEKFEQKVKNNCSGVTGFKIIGGEPQQRIEDVIKRKFQIEVNGKARYDVYPHLEAMIEKPTN